MATVRFYHVQRSDFDSRTICFGNEQVRLPFALYDTQLEIINELLDSFVEEKHIVIESATGSGKTACFLIAVEVYLALVDENVQFMILVRTMDQLVQTLNQFRCLSFVASCNYGFIAGRDYLCTDPDIRKCPTDKDNLCRRKLEQGCFLEMSLSRKFSKLEDMTNNLSIENAKVPDVEDLKHFLKKEDACPYFACHKLYARNVSVLICNQKYLFGNDGFGPLKQFCEAFLCILEDIYKNWIKTPGKRRPFYPFIDFIDCVVDKDPFNRLDASSELSPEAFLNVLRTRAEQYKKALNITPSDLKFMFGFLISVKNATHLFPEYIEDYWVIFWPQEKDTTFERVQMGIWPWRSKVPLLSSLRLVKCMCFVSGTLSPGNWIKNQLGLSDNIIYSQKTHVLENDRFAVYAYGHNDNGERIRFVFQNYTFSRGPVETVTKLWNDVFDAIKPVASYSNGCGMVFFPNRLCLIQLLGNVKESTIQERLGSTVKLYFDNIRNATGRKEFLQEVKEKRNNAVLFTYYRGSLSEGMDLPHLAYAVAVGVPIPSFRTTRCAFIQKVSREELNLRDPLLTNGVQAVAQALGRCLRKKNSKGILVMIDSRYTTDVEVTQILNLFPLWIACKVEHFTSHPNFVQAVRNKYDELLHLPEPGTVKPIAEQVVEKPRKKTFEELRKEFSRDAYNEGTADLDYCGFEYTYDAKSSDEMESNHSSEDERSMMFNPSLVLQNNRGSYDVSSEDESVLSNTDRMENDALSKEEFTYENEITYIGECNTPVTSKDLDMTKTCEIAEQSAPLCISQSGQGIGHYESIAQSHLLGSKQFGSGRYSEPCRIQPQITSQMNFDFKKLRSSAYDHTLQLQTPRTAVFITNNDTTTLPPRKKLRRRDYCKSSENVSSEATREKYNTETSICLEKTVAITCISTATSGNVQTGAGSGNTATITELEDDE